MNVERMQCMEIWGGNQSADQHFQMPGLDVWVNSVPYAGSASGGDVYYLSSCASGRITRFLLADVSGHGERVAGVARALRDLMRKHVNHISQAGFVEALNDQFSTVAQEGCFATALVCTYFASTESLQLCLAGHPPPFVYDHKSARWSMSLPDKANRAPTVRNTPLGVIEKVEYTQVDSKLKPGDMVFAYTDGLIEARAANGEMLGIEGLQTLLNSLTETRPSELIATLLTRTANPSTDDDVSMMLCQANGSGVPLRNTLLAPFRLLRGKVVDATRLR